MTINDFIQLRDMISIAEHTPGYLELRVSPRILSHPAAFALKDAGRGNLPPGVRMGVNIFALTVTIEYELETVSPDDFEEFLTSDDTGRVHALAAKAAAFFGLELEDGGTQPA